MAEPDDTPLVEHSQTKHDLYGARWFTAESLQQIDAELHKGPFDKIDWVLKDDHSKHQSSSLTALLDQVPWAQVTEFVVSAIQHVHPRPDGLGTPKTAYVSVDSRFDMIAWSVDDGTDVEGTRLAIQRVREVIEALPKSGRRSKFGSPPPPISSRFKRPPEGAREWLQVSAAVIVVGSAVLALMLKLFS